MNAFFRSALFPLIVIVLLVYLAGQTFMSDNRPETEMTYAEAQRLLQEHPEQIAEITLRPSEREAVVELRDGATAKTPSSENNGTPFWWYGLIGSFVIIAVFVPLMNRWRARSEEDLTAQVRNRSTA